MRGWIVSGVVGWSACVSQSPPPNIPPPPPSTEAEAVETPSATNAEPPAEATGEHQLLASKGMYGTCVMYVAGGTQPTPPEIDQAARQAERAAELGANNQWAAAAEAYWAAAETLRIESKDYGDTVMANRRIGYANAVLSWLNADDEAAAQKALEQAALDDKALADDLRAVAGSLPNPPSCGLRPL